MRGSGTIGLEIDLGVWIGGLNLQAFPGRHLVKQYLGLEDRQGAIQPLGIQVFVVC